MSSESTEQEAFPTIPVKRIAKRDEIDLLDYLFHDKTLKGLNYYKTDINYSDHVPVFMKVAL